MEDIGGRQRESVCVRDNVLDWDLASRLTFVSGACVHYSCSADVDGFRREQDTAYAGDPYASDGEASISASMKSIPVSTWVKG